MCVCVCGFFLLFPTHPVSCVTFHCQAIHGQAIDRHLLGLKMLSIEDLTSMPEIFMDTSFAVAEHYNLSTSQACLRLAPPFTGLKWSLLYREGYVLKTPITEIHEVETF